MLIPAYLLSAVFLATGIGSAAAEADKHTILILGGGVAGVIAARTFHENGIDDFVIIDAQNDLGGRMQPREFGGHVIELGPNWIQGTQTGSGPANPIFELAKKHGLKSQFNDWFGSISRDFLFYFRGFPGSDFFVKRRMMHLVFMIIWTRLTMLLITIQH